MHTCNVHVSRHVQLRLCAYTGPLIHNYGNGEIIGIYTCSLRQPNAHVSTCLEPDVQKVVYVNLAAPAINDLITEWLALAYDPVGTDD